MRNLTFVIFVAVCVLCCASPHAMSAIDDGLIAYWSLDESSGNVANDLLGGHDGTLQQSASWVSGLLGGAVDTNGNGYVTVTEHAELMPSAVSISAWVSVHSFGSWEGLVGNVQDNGSYESGFCLYVNSSGVTWYASDGSFKSISTSVTREQWTHFVGTYDGQYLRLYKNGAEVSGSPVAVGGALNWNYVPIEMNIGRYNDDNENYLADARIDEVAMWSRGLSGSEVAYLYNSGNGNPPLASATVLITETGENTQVTEGGPSDSYSMELMTEPSGTVEITATPSDGQIDLGNGPGQPVVVTFDSADWRLPQTITVVAVDDAVYEGKLWHESTISHVAVGGGYEDSEIPDIVVQVIDNDKVCGDWGYLPTDLNEDCYVDLKDFAIIAAAWLESF